MTAKEILDKLISQEPQSTKEKYVFLVGDNEHLYKQIMAARYIALQMDADQLEVYLDKDLYYTESHIKD